MLQIVTLLGNVLSDTLLVDGFDLFAAIWTPVVYTCLATFIHFRGTQMFCWPPLHWTREEVEYAEAFCYVSPVFHFPDHIPMAYEEDLEEYRLKERNWHAYVFIGFFAGTFFTVTPFVLWRATQALMSLGLKTFLEKTEAIRTVTIEEQKEEEIAKLAEELMVTLYKREISKPFISPIYMMFLIKLVYLMMACAQFLFIPHFLQMGNDYLWSWKMMMSRFQGVDRDELGVFPDKVLCQFEARTISGMNAEYVMQCLMANNHFYEKIFISISNMHLISAFLIIGGIFVAIRSIFTRNLVESMLHGSEQHQESRAEIKEFSSEFVGLEGRFVLYFINQRDSKVAKQLVTRMFDDFKKSKNLPIASASSTPATNDTATSSSPIASETVIIEVEADSCSRQRRPIAANVSELPV